MKTWRRATLTEPCGRCGKAIAEGAPELVITVPGLSRRIVRCVSCAGEPVDEERLAIQDEALAQDGEQPNPKTGAIRQPFEFTGATRDLFDPKLAQTGERE